jgi:hypothetical protein
MRVRAISTNISWTSLSYEGLKVLMRLIFLDRSGCAGAIIEAYGSKRDQN